MRDVVLIVIILFCCAVAVRKPFIGMLIYVAVGLTGPHSFAWGIARTIPMAQLVAGATFLGLILFKPPMSWPKEREVKILFGLFLVFCFTTIFAVAQDLAVTKLLAISKMFVMIVVIMALVHTKEHLWWLLRVIALCIGFFGLKGGIWVIATGGHELVYGPEHTFLSANNSIGLAMAMNLPILFYLFRVETNKWLKYVFFTMFLFSYPAIICTYSRGAWLGALLATILIFWFTRQRFLWLIMGGIMAVTISASMIAFDLIPERIAHRFDQLVHADEESSAQSRLWSWEFCRRVGFANPITGAGFNYYSREMYAHYYPEFLTRYTRSTTYWSCHSMWFTILGEQGFIGAGLWLSLLGSCLLGLWKAGKISLYLRDQTLHLFSRMLVGVLFVYMLVGTFLDVAYFEFFFQIVAAIICFKAIVKTTQRQRVQEARMAPTVPLRVGAAQ